MLNACAPMKPVPRPWPRPADQRVRVDGSRVRAYGASLKSAEAAAVDARRALRDYASALGSPYEGDERRIRFDQAASAAAVQTLPSKTGYSAVAELELAELQRILSTHYDLP